jgi:hypothetical protein
MNDVCIWTSALASLFAYCTEALGLCESAAGRRIAAARVCRRFSSAFERVASGELHLSVLCALGAHLTSENAAELFELCSRKSRRQIDELLAARFPKPDVRESIRRLPTRAEASEATKAPGAPEATNTPEVTGFIAETARAEGASVGPTPTSALLSAPPPARRQTLEPLSVGRFGVHFTADSEFRDLLERARALASHRLPNGDLATVMKLALEAFVRDAEKQRFALGRKARRNSTHVPREAGVGAGWEALEARQALPRSRRDRAHAVGHAMQAAPPPGESVVEAFSAEERAEPRLLGQAQTALSPRGIAVEVLYGDERTERRIVGQAQTALSPGGSAVVAFSGEERAEARVVDRAALPPGGSAVEAFSGGERPEACVASGATRVARGRHIPAAVVREVYLRDQGRCSFVSESGRRCDSRAFLELDHCLPYALGGASTPENLRLRCRGHNPSGVTKRVNQRHVEAYFGREQIDAAIARKRRGCANKAAR